MWPNDLHFCQVMPVWLWPCFKRQAFISLKLVCYPLPFGEECLISHKLNVYVIADHLAFHGQLCSPEGTGVSVAKEVICLVVTVSHPWIL